MEGSLGLITVASAGTPQQVVATHTPCHSYIVQAAQGNTGRIFVGVKGMNKSTLVGVLYIIGAPASATATPPSFSNSNAVQMNGFDLQNLYLDADNGGEGATVAYDVS